MINKPVWVNQSRKHQFEPITFLRKVEPVGREKKDTIKGGGVVEWFRALDLKSGGPWFKSSTLPLSGFVLGSPEFNSSTAL